MQSALRQSRPQTGLHNRRAVIQPSLTIGQPGDAYEQEADRVADQVVNAPGNMAPAQAPLAGTGMQVQRNAEEESDGLQMKPIMGRIQRMETEEGELQMKCAACGQEEAVQRKPTAIQKKEGGGMTASPQITQQLSSRKGQGQALSPDLSQEMGTKMGADFSQVRVHTDSNAVQMSQDLGARAFTHGNDIYFNSGQYDPGSKSGKHLLAHELTHTVQQTGGLAPMLMRQSMSGPSSLMSVSLSSYKDQSVPTNDPADLSDAAIKACVEFDWAMDGFARLDKDDIPQH